MSWTLLVALVLGLGLALLAAWSRRIELARMQRRVKERERNVRVSKGTPQLQHPVIDLTRCLGCGTCVAVCPEKGVLELVHGQAMVVNGSRCTGVSACERECPVGAITVTLTNVEERRDIPAISTELEAVGTPGLFLAGEVTAHALIKSAIEQGTAVADEVARRRTENPMSAEVGAETLDLCVVGAGPAGLACSLEAKRHGLSFVTLDQADSPGGTVAKYPRRKLVMTQPVDLPLHGRLERNTYSKEELIDLWLSIAKEEALPIHGGQVFEGVERRDDGSFTVHTTSHQVHARNVCIAIGRRGVPRKLEVPGEELSKVAYSLIDASSYQNRRILVVGGGDSAVEAALGLCEQEGNDVTLSYRGEAFTRIRLRNEEHLEEARANGLLRVLLSSNVRAIRPDMVEIEMSDGPSRGLFALPNDEVFIMAGGIPPFELLERSGVSFDPSLREPIAPVREQGTGMVRALTAAFLLALATLAFALKHADFYTLPITDRPVHDSFKWLRSSSGLGLWFGFLATVLVIVNLLYLLRRGQKLKFTFGSLRTWMTSHVATGILAFLLALLHGGMLPGNTPGGHALWALGALLITGAVGRYFYAYVPRAANGRELALEEVKVRLGRLAEDWDASQKEFVEHAQKEIMHLVESRQWKSSLFGRALALIRGQRELRHVLAKLEQLGRETSVPADRIEATLGLARQAYKLALMAAHYEDLRALLNSWRYVHRWAAVVMVVLVIAHIWNALNYGSMFSGGSS